MRPEVSVIVPFYNLGNLIEESILSALDQGPLSVEVVAVDDGSSDGSGELVEKIAKNDYRVKLLRQENRGLSAARNAGLETANGKYVMFLDGDDLLPKASVPALVRAMEAQNLDVIFFQALSFNHSSEVQSLELETLSVPLFKRPLSGMALLAHQITRKSWAPSACLQLARLEYLKAEALKFQEGIIHEDNLYTFSVLSKAQNTNRTEVPSYLRRLRANSITRSTKTWDHVSGLLACHSGILQSCDTSPPPRNLTARLRNSISTRHIARVCLQNAFHAASGIPDTLGEIPPTANFSSFAFENSVRALKAMLLPGIGRFFYMAAKASNAFDRTILRILVSGGNR